MLLRRIVIACRRIVIACLSVVLMVAPAVAAQAAGPVTTAKSAPAPVGGSGSGTLGTGGSSARPTTQMTSGKRSFQLPSAGGLVHAASAAGNPAKNIPPNPAFPDRCYQAYQSTDCVNSVVAALNNARKSMGLPNYILPAGFGALPVAYQFLALSNADRVLAGRTPITAFNPTLNAVAQHAADISDDPGGAGAPVPASINGINWDCTAASPAVPNCNPTPGDSGGGWSANWAGGMSPLEAYYDWMYDDGIGSNNVDCQAATDPGCWGHRQDTLANFGTNTLVAMGVGTDFSGKTYGSSWTEIYWAYHTTSYPGKKIPHQAAVYSVAAGGGPAAGGTTVTLTGVGLDSVGNVAFGNVTSLPISKSVNRVTVKSPKGTGVQPVRTNSDGGTSLPNPIATFSYLAGFGPGSFVPVVPARDLDTRIGLGANKLKVPSLATLRLPVLGRGHVPASGVAAVVLNVIAIDPTRSGYLTIFQSGAAQPRTSNLDFLAHQTVTNLVVVPVGHDGKVAMFNGSAGTVDMVADVSGYYLAGTPVAAGSYRSINPARLLDTRIGVGAPKARVVKTGIVRVPVTGRSGIPLTGVSSVFVNVTVVNPAAAGYLTVYGDGAARPTASNLDFQAKQTIPNLVLTPVGADGKIAIFNGSTSTVDILADVVGYVRAGAVNTRGAIVPVAPSRTFDSRKGIGVATFAPYDFPPPAGQMFVVGGTYRVPVLIAGRHGIPAVGVAAVVLNVTVTDPNALGYYTAYADGQPLPKVSNLDFAAGQTVPNLVIVPVAKNGMINLFNGSSSYNGLIIDVAGYILG